MFSCSEHTWTIIWHFYHLEGGWELCNNSVLGSWYSGLVNFCWTVFAFCYNKSPILPRETIKANLISSYHYLVYCLFIIYYMTVLPNLQQSRKLLTSKTTKGWIVNWNLLYLYNRGKLGQYVPRQAIRENQEQFLQHFHLSQHCKFDILTDFMRIF